MKPVRRRHLFRWLSGLALLCVVPSTAFSAEFVEFYKNGVTAADSQNWTLTADMMRKAIAEQPKAKVRVKKALYFKRYIPHFYLGKALFETGDCTGAFEAWRESESQGVVQRYPEFQEILEGRSACGQMVDLQAALDDALRAVGKAEASATQSRRRLSVLPEEDPVVRELLTRQTDAEASLGRVRMRLTSGEVALSEVEQAAMVAEVAEKEFHAIRNRATALGVDRSEARLDSLVAEIEMLMNRARKDLRSSEYLQPYPASVESRRRALIEALERGRGFESGALNAGELEALHADLTRAGRDFRRSVAPPPVQLEEAANAYLAGDYSGALSILADADLVGSRAAFHTHLLQAASYFALYYSTGAMDETWLEQARAAVLDCRSVDPERSPPTEFFSPRFVDFFEGQIASTPNAESDSQEEEGP